MKTVIITGGTQGIGADIARKFMDTSWNVLIGARSKSGLAGESHENLKFQKMDVREESGHQKLIQTAIEWTGSLDCYINCAGFSRWSSVKDVGVKFLSEMLDINLKGTFLCSRAAVRHMIPKRAGVIVSLASISGKEGNANMAPYSVSKAGVICFTKTLAKEVLSEGIRVNCVAPALIDTPILQGMERERVDFLTSKIRCSVGLLYI